MDPNVPKDAPATSKSNEGYYDEARVALGQPGNLPNLKRKLKSRHLQMIAIGEWSIFSLYMTTFLI